MHYLCINLLGKPLKTMFWFFRLISCYEEKITGWALKFSIHTLERIPILTLSCSVKQWYQIIIVALYQVHVCGFFQYGSISVLKWNVVKRILINKYFPLDWTVLNLNGSNFMCGCMTDLFIQYVTDRDVIVVYISCFHLITLWATRKDLLKLIFCCLWKLSFLKSLQ